MSYTDQKTQYTHADAYNTGSLAGGFAALDPLDDIETEELDRALDEAGELADDITNTLLDIVASQGLLDYFSPEQAVSAAKELWDAAREVAAGVVSANLNLAGYPFDVTFVGQAL